MGGSDETVFGGRYRVIRRVGAGGTATVYLAEDALLQRAVAIKRLHGAEVTAETAQRLQREARIMAALRHPNLVAVYDMLMDDDDLLLVMEYVDGETLADVLGAAPIGWQETLALLQPVAAALDYAHAEGVVHRDLKPSNVLVGAGGVVKLADLGLATAAEITRITPPGAILGTPAYMAPEQARAVPCTPAVDVYALATIVFQALSGVLPRAGKTVVAILAQATREPPADLRDHRPDTPEAAAAALMRAMSAQPEARQRSTGALLQELSVAFAGSQGRESAAGSPPPQRRPSRRRTRRNLLARLLAISALAAAFAGLALVVALLRAEQPQPTPTAPRARTTPTREPTRTATPTATETATPAAAQARSATATVRAFYRRAARGDYSAAWSLAGPEMRRAFGDSFERFRRDLSSLRRIEFQRLAILERDDASATVEVETIATHSNRTDRCSGTLRAVRAPGGGWLVDPAGLRCTSG